MPGIASSTVPSSPKRRYATSLALALLLAAPSLLIGCKSADTVEATEQPISQFIQKNIYSATANTKSDIAAAVAKAQRDHKRIILDFGANWCGDCLVLDYYFHQSPNLALLEKNFVLIHVDIGQYDHNVDIAAKYQVPLDKGVPALAVLDSDGKLLYSQENKEFTAMRTMNPSSVTEFLNRWKS